MLLAFNRYFRYFDWINFSLMSLLLAIGILEIFSATYRPEQPFSFFLKKQIIGIVLGLCIYFICSLLDYRRACRWGFYAYFIACGLLIITLIKGSIGMGAQRWINLFFFKAQPSELIKVLFPAFFTYLLAEDESVAPSWKTLLLSLAILTVSALLIIKQPDLGTALIILICNLLLFWLANAPSSFIISLIAGALIIAPLGWYTLKPYQKKRIAVFLGEGSSHKERYQLEQSKIAIGSGGLTGKGFLQGTQNKFQFLPEGRTDFIFSVICEEWGFLGGFLTLLLFALLFGRLFYVSITIKHQIPYTFLLGLLLPLVIETLINIGMVLGLAPIVGVPLPLISYGLCNLWITMASLGIINGITIRRMYH